MASAVRSEKIAWLDLRREFFFTAMVGLLPVLVLAPGLWHGTRSFFVWPDAQEQTYAWWQKLAQCWHSGYLPLWDANTFGGHSFVGEFQAGVFYPLAWAWLALWSNASGISVAALESFVLLHFVIAAIGMAAMLRHWRLGRVASASGAIVFALIGPFAARAASQPNIFFGLCWLPWALLTTSRHIDSGRARDAACTGAVIALQVLAGHVQPAFHTALLVAVMVIAHHWRTKSDWRSRLAAILRSALPMAATLVVITAPQWILSAQYLHDAYRWVGGDAPIGPGKRVPYLVYAYKSIVEPYDFLSLIDPWRIKASDANSPYFGTATLSLICWFFLAVRKDPSIAAWRIHGQWLLAVAIFAICAMLGHYTLVSAVLWRLPLVSGIRELGRYVILFHVAGCVLAAFAIQMLGTTTGRRREWFPILWIVLGSAFLAWDVGMHGSDWLSRASIWALVLSVAIWVVLLAAGRGRTAAIAALGSLIITAYLYMPNVTPEVDAAKPVTKAFASIGLLARIEQYYGRDRIIIDDSAKLPQNYADVHRLQTILGHDATMYRPYLDFLSRDWSIHGEVDDLLNVRYVLSRSVKDLPLVAADESSGLRLYERPTAYPRVFLMSQYGKDLPSRRAAFDLLRYDDHVQEYRIRASSKEQAVVSEVAYPGWCAYVNGKSARIERARLGGVETPLRTVWIEPGENTIEFRYRPFRSLLFGCD